MALATIDATQSYLGYRQNETFAFQPGIFSDSAITAVPTTGLPSGLTCDPTTGLIHGSVADVGIYVVGVRVTNTTGTTAAPVYFTIGIEPAGGSAVSGSSDVGIDVNIDVVSKEVTISGAAASSVVTDDEPLFLLKLDDVDLLNVRFFKGDIPIDPNPTYLRLALKEFDPDSELVLAGGAVDTAFERSGTGATAVCQLPVPLDDDALKAALSNHQRDSGTQFDALCDIRWKQAVDIAGTTELTKTTKTFRVRIAAAL